MLVTPRAQRPHSLSTSLTRRSHSVQGANTACKKMLQRAHGDFTANSQHDDSVLTALIAFKACYLYFIFYATHYCEHGQLKTIYYSILKQKSLVRILIYRFLYLNERLLEQYMNILLLLGVYQLNLINLLRTLHFDKHASLYNFVTCTCNTYSEKLICQIKYKLSKPNTYVLMDKKYSLL